MRTYVSIEYIENYLSKTKFLEDGVIPYIAVKDMINNAPKIDVEKITASKGFSDDMPYANDEGFKHYLYESMVVDMAKEIYLTHNEFIGKAIDENVPLPMTKTYRTQMMIAKPHEVKLSAEVMVALADMRG